MNVSQWGLRLVSRIPRPSSARAHNVILKRQWTQLRSRRLATGTPPPSVAKKRRVLPLRLWDSYVRVLETHPLSTNSITAGVLFGLGDLLCQAIEIARPTDATAADADPQAADSEWDWGRCLRMALHGLLVMGPINTFWYRFLDSARFAALARSMLSATTKRRMVLSQVFVDTAILSPGATVLFYISLSSMEGIAGLRPLSVRAVENRLRSHFVPTLLSDMSFWPAAQSVNFFFLPPTFRVLFISVTNLLWNSWLSHLQHSLGPSDVPKWMRLGKPRGKGESDTHNTH